MILIITVVSLYSLFLLKYSKLLLTIALYMQAKPFERTTKPMVASLKDVEQLITYSLFYALCKDICFGGSHS